MQRYLYQDLYELEDKHWWHIAKRKICLSFVNKVSKKKFLNILDVGCGTGKNLEAFSKLGKVSGIDISNEAIKFCKIRGFKNVKLGQAEKTTFKKNSFDLVTLLDVLEHTDDKKTLVEMKRILKKDGLLLITVPAFKFLWSNWDVVLHHKRRYTSKSLDRVLKTQGYDVVNLTYLYSFLVLPMLIVRFLKSIFFPKDYPSDFKIGSKFMNKMLLTISHFEAKIALNYKIPFGTTIICIAKKKT